MSKMTGLVTQSIMQAIEIGARWSGQGYGVRLCLLWPDQAVPDLEGTDHRPPASTDVAILVAGSPELAERAESLLQRWGAGPLQEPAQPKQGTRAPLPHEHSSATGVLVLVGSDKEFARMQVERLAEAGALVLTLSREAVLNQDETILMGLRSGAAAALKQGRHVVVRSENWPGAAEVTRRLAAKRWIPAEEVDRRVRTMLARVAEGVVAAGATSSIIAVGTDTVAALCRQLGIVELAVTAEVAPGLPALLRTGRSQPLLLVLKSGGAGDQDTLVQAVAALSRPR